MRKNVASQFVAFQAVSSTDGSAVTTGTPVCYYTIDGGTQGTSTNTAAHEGNGQWSLALTQAETNGNHIVYTFTVTGAISQSVNVYPVGYDETATNLPSDVVSISGDSTAADNLEAACDGTTYNIGGGAVVAASVTGAVGSVSAGGIAASSFAAGAIDATAIADTAIRAAKFDSAAITSTALAADCITANQIATNAIHATAIAQNAITASVLATDAVSEIADGVWDEARSGHVAAGSFGEGVASVTGAVGSVTGNVGGNVTGSVGSVAAGGIASTSFAAGAITATAIANNAIHTSALADGAISAGKLASSTIVAGTFAADSITASALAVDAVAEIQSGLATPTNITAGTITTVTDLTNERGKYANGAVWIGPTANTNTTSYVDGIVTNPVSTIAAAKTIADALKLRRFYTIRTGTTQIGADMVGYDFDGDAWSLTTTGGSRDVSTSQFYSAKVIGGTYASTSAESHWQDCEFSDGVSVAAVHMQRCTFTGTLTLNAAGNYDFIDCASVVAGTSAPVFAVPAGTVNISFRRWSGGITLTGITSGTTVSIDVVSGGTVTLEGAEGNVQVRGLVAGITDNRTGTPTLGQNAAINITKINTECDTALSDYDPPTNAELAARTLVAASYATAANQTTIAGKIDTIDTLLDRAAPIIIGTVTGAGTGTEVFVYGGVTATVTVDENGNRSVVAFS
jgi:hypothetical protein